MACIKTYLFIMFSIFIYKHHYILADTNLTTNEHQGNGVLKFFYEYFLKKKEALLGEILDNQLKNLISNENIRLLNQDIAEIATNIPDITVLKIALADLSILFDKIDIAYRLYLDYSKSNKNATDYSLHKFLDHTRSSYNGPIDYLNTIYSKVVPRNLDVLTVGARYLNDISVLSLLNKHMKDYINICDKSIAQQQILQMLFLSIRVAEIKLYSTLEFCFKKLADVGECNFNEEINSLKERLYDRSHKASEYFKVFMRIASREVWRCDPKNHVEDVTYTQLKQVFQKYVINDQDMNNENNCKKTCGTFDNAIATNCANIEYYMDLEAGYMERSICDQQRICAGPLYDCEDYFSNFNGLWICPSPLNSTRRYEFMKHGTAVPFFTLKTRDYGPKRNKKNCSRNMSYDSRRWGQSFTDFYKKCEKCLCTCHDLMNPTSDQTINVRAIYADNNYVVTGARLVKQDHILHIQIEQGKILSDGNIDNDTLAWKPIAKPTGKRDLRRLAWKSFRTVYLGVVEVPRGHVLVGITFDDLNSGNGRMLGFRTFSVPYDYSTGELTYHHDESCIIDPETLSICKSDPFPDITSNPIPNEAEVKLDNCDLPQNTVFPSLPDPDSKKIVKFTTSDFKTDLGQNMIPYIDIQDVIVRPATPLAGIGFYHKGREGYAGFLGIKLVIFDHSPYIG